MKMKLSINKKLRKRISNVIAFILLVSIVPLMIFIVGIALDTLSNDRMVEPVPGVQCFVFTRGFSIGVSCVHKVEENDG